MECPPPPTTKALCQPPPPDALHVRHIQGPPLLILTSSAIATEEGGPGMHWKGGRSPTPLQGAQSMPSHCLRDGQCQLQWHL